MNDLQPIGHRVRRKVLEVVGDNVRRSASNGRLNDMVVTSIWKSSPRRSYVEVSTLGFRKGASHLNKQFG